MTHDFLMSGASIEALCAVLAASIFVADCVMAEALCAQMTPIPAGGPSVAALRQRELTSLRHAARSRAWRTSRRLCLTRALPPIRIRGRR
jgi:hypothetical protein